MEIVYITSSSFIDADASLIRELVHKGVDVHLFLNLHPTGLRTTLLDIREQYPHEGVFDSSIYGDCIDFYKEYLGVKKIFVVNRLSSSLISGSRRLYKEQVELIDSINPDIVHHIGWPKIIDVPMMFKYRKKMVITIHDPVPHEVTRVSRLMRILRLLTSWPVKNYILLNDAQTDDFCAYYHKKKEFIHYAKLGRYDVMTLFGREEKSAYRTILFYGRISRYMGVDVLLNAFCKIKNKFNDVKLVIAGKGDFYFDVTPYQNDEQIEFRNTFITLDDLGTLIRNCEFSVCPYISATQSGVVASVLALGKPLIVTNVGGLPAMIKEGRSGLIVEPNDIDALANAMESLLEDKSKLDSMCDFIKEVTESEESSWDAIANKYMNIYNRIKK